MTFSFRPARRENVPLLIGVAGGTGSGKTMSALRLARGIANGQPFAGIDTENRRMNHYADRFPELHVAQITAPFRPERYTEAIDAGAAYLAQQGVPAGHRVVVVDSMSHEWAGDGGCLDWKDEITGGDDKRSPAAWAKVKPAHKRMLTRLLQVDAHVILCFRAEEKMDIVRENGAIKFVPKQTLPGGSLDGWVPVTEKNMPYELTASFLLIATAPGVPKPIKLEGDHRPFVPLDQPLSEQVGRALGEWAAGGVAAETPHGAAEETAVSNGAQTGPPASDQQRKKLDVLVGQLREAKPEPKVTTEQVYTAVARLRGITAAELASQVDGADADGLHWGPLRDKLTKAEASNLIERLQPLETRAVA